MVDKHDLSDMQKKLLEIFGYVHELCIANNIKYYTMGGTTLGAVRHQGFIPWDDDIDIGLPRDDYEKLIRIFPKANNKYVLESVYSNNDDFCYSFSKIYDTSTTLIENTSTRIKRGVYIDLFPIDGAGNSNKYSLSFVHIEILKKLLTLRTIKRSGLRKWYKNTLLYVVQHMPKCIFGEKRLAQRINTLCKKKSYNESQYVGVLLGLFGIKEILVKDCFGNPTLTKFEDMYVNIPEKPEMYLTSLYGDWRKLPPVEKRVTHHDYELNLNKSYLG